MKTPTFEFVNYNQEINVAGKKFTMDCSTDTSDYLKEKSQSLLDLSKAISDGTKPRDAAAKEGTEIIDHLLGAGATEKIFEGRNIRISDLMDICVFLAKTVREFNDEKRTGAHEAK